MVREIESLRGITICKGKKMLIIQWKGDDFPTYESIDNEQVASAVTAFMKPRTKILPPPAMPQPKKRKITIESEFEFSNVGAQINVHNTNDSNNSTMSEAEPAVDVNSLSEHEIIAKSGPTILRAVKKRRM